MPRYIAKLHNPKDGIDYYLEWSSVVDAPVTYAIPLDVFTKYYLTRYGESSANELKERLIRVEKQGCSCALGQTIEDLIEVNRAGDNEKRLTLSEILHKYIYKDQNNVQERSKIKSRLQ